MTLRWPVDVSDNTSLWGPPPAASRALREVPGDALARYPSADSLGLRRALAAYTGTVADQVFTGGGSDDVIDCAFRAFAAPGDAVAFCVPTFSMVPRFARASGLEVRAVPFRSDGELDVEALLATGARTLYVASPNNPTGTEVSARALETLLRGARGLVVIDEAYGEFADRSVVSWLGRFPQLLVTRTLSKAFGLAGLRIGYGLGAPEVVHALQSVRAPYRVNALGEQAAIAALTEDLGWVRARVAEACEVRLRLCNALRSAGFTVLPSTANFLCMPVRDAQAWGERLLERGIRVRSLIDLPGLGDAVRISVGPWETMEPVLEALWALRSEGLQ